jgi:methanogenic corrinoid protein MtbC1
MKQSIAEIIEFKKSFIAEQVVEMQYADNPKYWEKYGEKGKQFSIRDAAYHLPFLAEAIIAEDETIFTEYVQWVKRLFESLNFHDAVMTNTLICTNKVLKKELTPEQAAITEKYIKAGIEQMAVPLTHLDSYIDESTDLGVLARQYIDSLLKADRMHASKLLIDAVENGTSVKDIYLEVFQKSQYEIGRLWLTNQISVAKEHYCSAATQLIMSRMYPYIFTTERKGRSMVAASIGGELHEIGIRMVADFFEMDGWDTYYMGANTPTSSIIQAAEENEAQIIGLSIAIPYHGNKLTNVIEEIRNSSIGKDVKILIGGNALNKRKNPSEKFRVDAYASNALDAVNIANTLVN